MTAIKTIEALAPELAYPGYWNQRRLIYLSAILATNTKGNKRITAQDLPNLQARVMKEFTGLCGDGATYKFDKAEKQRCNEVLEFLTLNGWRCSYFVTQKKLPRPSITTTSPDELVLWQLGQKFITEFWDGKVSIAGDSKLLVFWLELLSYAALSPAALNRLLAADFGLIFNATEGVALLPIDDNAVYQLSIRLSSRQQILMHDLVRSKQLTKQATKQLIQKTIGQCLYESVTPSFFEHVDDVLNVKAERLIRMATYQAPFNGIEPILASAIARDQTPVPIQQKEIARAIYKPLVCRHEPRLERQEQVSADDDQEELSEVFLPSASRDQNPESYLHEAIEWQLECRLTIRRIRHQVRKSLTGPDSEFRNSTVDASLVKQLLASAKGGTIQNTREATFENQLFGYEKVQIEEQLEKLSTTVTGLDLAIDRIRYHLIECENTFDTCFKEISAIFLHGFLAYEPGWNLQQWDEEDFELLTSEYILARDGRATTNETTRQQTVSSLNRVIRFSRDQFGLFRNIATPKLTPQGRVFTSRNNIVTLKEFDALIESTGELDSAILILAFYAGMRSGEIINLSLNDVANSRRELTVYVREGKTPSAKRAIPLHRLMPPNLLRKVQTVVELREIDYRKFMRGKSASKNIDRARANFRVFVRSEIDGHQSGQVILSETRETLRDRLGRKADLHLLRHSFASWFFLRWYAAKYPDFIDSLTSNDHWLFSDDGIKNIKQFLGVFTAGPIPSEHSNAMIFFIKLFGHANTATLFQVYIHTYEFVLDHALKNAYRGVDSESMKGKLITALIPKMKSRATQSKLQDRSASGLLQRI